MDLWRCVSLCIAFATSVTTGSSESSQNYRFVEGSNATLVLRYPLKRPVYTWTLQESTSNEPFYIQNVYKSQVKTNFDPDQGSRLTVLGGFKSDILTVTLSISHIRHCDAGVYILNIINFKGHQPLAVSEVRVNVGKSANLTCPSCILQFTAPHLSWRWVNCITFEKKAATFVCAYLPSGHRFIDVHFERYLSPTFMVKLNSTFRCCVKEEGHDTKQELSKQQQHETRCQDYTLNAAGDLQFLGLNQSWPVKVQRTPANLTGHRSSLRMSKEVPVQAALPIAPVHVRVMRTGDAAEAFRLYRVLIFAITVIFVISLRTHGQIWKRMCIRVGAIFCICRRNK